MNYIPASVLYNPRPCAGPSGPRSSPGCLRSVRSSRGRDCRGVSDSPLVVLTPSLANPVAASPLSIYRNSLPQSVSYWLSKLMPQPPRPASPSLRPSCDTGLRTRAALLSPLSRLLQPRTAWVAVVLPRTRSARGLAAFRATATSTWTRKAGPTMTTRPLVAHALIAAASDSPTPPLPLRLAASRRGEALPRLRAASAGMRTTPGDARRRPPAALARLQGQRRGRAAGASAVGQMPARPRLSQSAPWRARAANSCGICQPSPRLWQTGGQRLRLSQERAALTQQTMTAALGTRPAGGPSRVMLKRVQSRLRLDASAGLPETKPPRPQLAGPCLTGRTATPSHPGRDAGRARRGF